MAAKTTKKGKSPDRKKQKTASAVKPKKNAAPKRRLARKASAPKKGKSPKPKSRAVNANERVKQQPSANKASSSKTAQKNAPLPITKSVGFKTSFTLEEQKLLKTPASQYMNKAMLEFFKKRLLDLRAETFLHIEEVRKELANEEPQADELDKAVMEEERMLKLRVIERESKLLPKIEYALRKISTGEYGYCEETGEPIGVERLLLRPTATFSVEAKEFLEQKEKEFNDETLGHTLTATPTD